MTSNNHVRVPLNTQSKLSAPVNGKTQDGHQNFSQHLKLEDTESNAVAIAAQIDQNLLVSGSALGLAVVGSLIYPPLSLLYIPAMIWVCLPITQTFQKQLKQFRRYLNEQDVEALEFGFKVLKTSALLPRAEALGLIVSYPETMLSLEKPKIYRSPKRSFVSSQRRLAFLDS